MVKAVNTLQPYISSLISSFCHSGYCVFLIGIWPIRDNCSYSHTAPKINLFLIFISIYALVFSKIPENPNAVLYL